MRGVAAIAAAGVLILVGWIAAATKARPSRGCPGYAVPPAPAANYRDTNLGFSLLVPSGLHAGSFAQGPSPTRDLESRVGTAVSNLAHPERGGVVQRALPSDAVLLTIGDTEGGPLPRPEPSLREPPVRLTRDRFVRLRGRWQIPGRADYDALLYANGWSMWASVLIGDKATRANRAAIWRVAASVRFRSMEVGETTGDFDYLVGQCATAYPVGSINHLAGAWLIHGPHGFYALGDRPEGGRPLCNATPLRRRVVARRIVFACPGGKRWDRMGRALWRNHGVSDDVNLWLRLSVVAQDGHVLVSKDSEFSGSMIETTEREVWR